MTLSGRQVWSWHATHGVPIELSIPLLADRGVMVTWQELLTAANEDGANWLTLIPRLQGVVTDAYAGEVASVINNRLDGIKRAVVDATEQKS